MIRDLTIDGKRVTYATFDEFDLDELDRPLDPPARERLRQATNLRHWQVWLFEGREPLHHLMHLPTPEQAAWIDAQVEAGRYGNETFAAARLTYPVEVLCPECGWSGPALAALTVTGTLDKELRGKFLDLPFERECPSCGTYLRLSVVQWI